MGRDLSRLRARVSGLFQVPLDLLAARTRSLHVLLGISFDLRLAAHSGLDFIAEVLEPERQFRAVGCGSVLLRPIKFLRLQRASSTRRELGQIEENNVRMQLWGGVALHRAAGIMLKLRSYPLAGCNRSAVAAQACLHILFKFI